MSLPSVNGHCPACGGATLFLADGGHVTCSLDTCPNPGLVADLLDKRDQHAHLILFREGDFTIQHPLAERLAPGGLFECDLHAEVNNLAGPPGLGLYWVGPGQSVADARRVEQASTDFDVPVAPELRETTPIGTITGFALGADVPDGFVRVTRGRQHIPEDAEELREFAEANPQWPWDLDGRACLPGLDDFSPDGDDFAPEHDPTEAVAYVIRVR